MPFICLKRTDIPNSTLQITDLWPNKSQFNAAIDPPAVGPKYINAPITNNVALSGLFAFMLPTSGLAAYLVANVQGGAGPATAALTPTQANAMAAAIIAAMQAGAVLNLAAINALLAGVLAGTVLSGGASLSTGLVSDVLRILSSVTYTVPAGTTVQLAGVFTPQVSPTVWNAANFAQGSRDILATDSSFYDSLSYGKIAGFKATTFSYKGVTGAALTVYDNAGAVY